MTLPQNPSVGIVGLGQIGGSIALDLLGNTQVSFFARSTETQKAGTSAGLELAMTLGELAARSDIIFVAVPVDETTGVLESLSNHLQGDQIVTDVGSTKAKLCESAKLISWPDRVEFIGGHPMAGTDLAGFAAARKGMFSGRTWILTSDGGEDSSRMEAFIALVALITGRLHARVAVMDAATHDHSVALVSHLEHLVALALVNLVRRSDDSSMLAGLAAGSFFDATRVSKSSGAMVVPFLRENRYLPSVADEFRSEIARVSNLLGESKSLSRLWEQSSEWRSRLEGRAPASESIELPADSSFLEAVMRLTREGRFVKRLEEQISGVLLELS